MKNILLKVVSILGLVACMVAIFVFSCENAETSDATSGRLIKKICELLVDGFENLSEEQKHEMIGGYQAVIRTMAHFCIFVALGFFATLSLLSFGVKTIKNFAISFPFSVLYAVSDEIHQYFVPGRAFQFSDILVDSLGSLMGICFVIVLALLICKKGSSQNKND